MSSSPYPSLDDFQYAHRKLLREYVAAIDVASRLPFFVNLTRILIPYENENAHERFNRQLWFLLTPLIWKPFVRFLIEAHIKSKLGELSVSYNQLALQLPDNKKFNRLRETLKSAVIECNQFNDTLTSWKNGKTLVSGLVPITVGWITSWLSTDNLLAASPQFSASVVNLFSGNFELFSRAILGIVISSSLLFGLLNEAFEAKRSIFLPTYVWRQVEVSTYNIYATENVLFKLVGHKKALEFALDLVVGVFYIIIMSISAFLINYSFYPLSSVSIWLLIIFFGLMVFMTAYLIIRYARRWN